MDYQDDGTGRQRWMLQPIGQSVAKLPCKWSAVITLSVFMSGITCSETICQ